MAVDAVIVVDVDVNPVLTTAPPYSSDKHPPLVDVTVLITVFDENMKLHDDAPAG